MKKMMLLMLLMIQWGFTGLTLAATWNARTTRTNTAVTDTDIQQALSSGISPAFTLHQSPSSRWLSTAPRHPDRLILAMDLKAHGAKNKRL